MDYYIFKELMPEDNYARLRDLIPALPLEQPIKDFNHDSYSADIVAMAKAGFKFEVERPEKMEDHTFACHVLEQLAKIHESLDARTDIRKSTITLNLEQSHDAFLTKVTQVAVHEDLCTDELQKLITEGWRIIAVCPQKGSRRPDYVMGMKESGQ